MKSGEQQKGRDSVQRVDEAQEGMTDFWKNPENVVRLLDLIFLGSEEGPNLRDIPS
jgi:hypothetical protein